MTELNDEIAALRKEIRKLDQEVLSMAIRTEEHKKKTQKLLGLLRDITSYPSEAPVTFLDEARKVLAESIT